MVALADTPHPALRIQHALDELISGNSLEYLRLQHTLRGTNPTTLSPILSGLTHFAIKLHQDAPQRPLHTLFNAALQIDLPTVANNTATLSATAAFLRNLLSADASFIEPVLQLCTRAFLLPVSGREELVEAVYEILEFLLCTHPRAGALVVGVLRDRYPHPVRAAEEHAPYMRGVLTVSRRCTSISKALTNVVYERVAAVEALVPKDDDTGNDMEKMEMVLEELFYHFDNALGKGFHDVFEAAYEAYEAFVVPCEARFTPYSLLYGAEIGGIAPFMVERLRVRFFDRGMSAKLGEKFLEHSSGMVIRCRGISQGFMKHWLKRMADWLNAYIDSAERRGCDREVDVDIHHLFYAGCAALVNVCVRRNVDGEVVAGLRVGRIIACGMRPLVMLDEGIVQAFLKRLHGFVVCVEDRGYRPSKTRFGGRNVFEFGERLPNLVLPRTRERVAKVVRWDCDGDHHHDVYLDDDDAYSDMLD